MDTTMIIMRIVAVSVFLYLLRWLFLFILATVLAVRRRLTTSGKILTLLVGSVLCWWLVVHLADMADMAKQRLEWSVVLRRILFTLIPILFFKWLIRHFMLVASSSWQVVSDAEAEDGGDNYLPSVTTNKKPLVICFGEMLIDFVPIVAGESLRKTSGFVKAPGGAPANVAVAIARLGGNSAFIGKLGEDEFGRMLDEILEENGVNRQGVRFDNDARTALSFVTLKEDGEREFMFYRHPSADMQLRESELDFDLIRKATILHFGSVSLISEPCRGAHLAAIKAARAAGILLSYDPNVRLPLWPSSIIARQRIMSIWNQVHFIKVSCDEVEFLIEKDPYDDDVVMSNLWFDGLKLLLVTDGNKGCRYFTKDLRGNVKGFMLSPRVDTTGAGDAFVGALLFSLAKDTLLYQDEQKLREALQFASACGALTTTKKGAIPALPTANMALDLLKKSSLQ